MHPKSNDIKLKWDDFPEEIHPSCGKRLFKLHHLVSHIAGAVNVYVLTISNTNMPNTWAFLPLPS